MQVSTAEFMGQYADVAQTATASGYNPLLESYMNTKMYISRAMG